MLENPEAARAEPSLAQHAGERIRRGAIAAEHDQSSPRSEVPADIDERPAVGAEARHLHERPPQAGAYEAESGRRRQHPQLARIEASDQELAHPEPHRVTARQHDDAPPP